MDSEFFSMVYRPVLIIGIALSVIIAVTAVVTAFSAEVPMTLEQLPLIMVRALLITVAVECAVAWLLGVRTLRDQKVVVLANILTNPILVSTEAAILLLAGRQALLYASVLLEILAISAEALVYIKRIHANTGPLILSLACNLASVATGEILERFIF